MTVIRTRRDPEANARLRELMRPLPAAPAPQPVPVPVKSEKERAV